MPETPKKISKTPLKNIDEEKSEFSSKSKAKHSSPVDKENTLVIKHELSTIQQVRANKGDLDRRTTAYGNDLDKRNSQATTSNNTNGMGMKRYAITTPTLNKTPSDIYNRILEENCPSRIEAIESWMKGPNEKRTISSNCDDSESVTKHSINKCEQPRAQFGERSEETAEETSEKTSEEQYEKLELAEYLNHRTRSTGSRSYSMHHGLLTTDQTENKSDTLETSMASLRQNTSDDKSKLEINLERTSSCLCPKSLSNPGIVFFSLNNQPPFPRPFTSGSETSTSCYQLHRLHHKTQSRIHFDNSAKPIWSKPVSSPSTLSCSNRLFSLSYKHRHEVSGSRFGSEGRCYNQTDLLATQTQCKDINGAKNDLVRLLISINKMISMMEGENSWQRIFHNVVIRSCRAEADKTRGRRLFNLKLTAASLWRTERNKLKILKSSIGQLIYYWFILFSENVFKTVRTLDDAFTHFHCLSLDAIKNRRFVFIHSKGQDEYINRKFVTSFYKRMYRLHRDAIKIHNRFLKAYQYILEENNLI